MTNTHSAPWLRPEAVTIPDVTLGRVTEYGNYAHAIVRLDGTDIGTIVARPGLVSGVKFTVHAWGGSGWTATAWNLNAAVEMLLEYRRPAAGPGNYRVHVTLIQRPHETDPDVGREGIKEHLLATEPPMYGPGWPLERAVSYMQSLGAPLLGRRFKVLADNESEAVTAYRDELAQSALALLGA